MTFQYSTCKTVCCCEVVVYVKAKMQTAANENEFKIIKRGRGRILICAGYEYYRVCAYESKNTLWRCASYKKTKCNGTITISADEQTAVKKTEHIDLCVPDINKTTMAIIINNSIQEIVSGSDTAPAVYKKTVAGLKDSGIDLINEIPPFEKIKSSIYRQRNKEHQVKKTCYIRDSVMAVEVPSKYSDFLLADFNDDVRILVFCSNEARDQLRKSKIYLGDGTFKICPEPFKGGVYTIHADLNSSEYNTALMPLIYVLLSDRTKETYLKMFRIIKSQIPEWEPTLFVTDFEEAVIQAFKKLFPNAEHQGCYYHFTNTLWRKAKRFKLTCKRKNRIVGLCCVLPLLPKDCVTEGFNYVVSQIDDFEDKSDLKKFINYMQFWMKRQDSWNVFGKRHRTTNYAEGWHRAINGMYKTRPATIVQFLNNLKQDAAFFAVRTKNKLTTKRTKSQIENDAFIRHVQMQLLNGDINVATFLEKLRAN